MVWPTCGSSVMKRDTSTNAQDTALDTNPNPNPDPNPNPNPYSYELCLDNTRRFFSRKFGRPHYKLSDIIFPEFHTLSLIIIQWCGSGCCTYTPGTWYMVRT